MSGHADPSATDAAEFRRGCVQTPLGPMQVAVAPARQRRRPAGRGWRSLMDLAALTLSLGIVSAVVTGAVTVTQPGAALPPASADAPD